MRESIGGTMLFWIVLFFMSIFIAFLAAVVQYARVYKIKNSMINYLEQGEGVASKEMFESALANFGYPSDGKYVVCRYKAPERGGYYYVKLYATFAIMSFSLDVKIKGETRLIETGVFVRSDGLFDDVDSENNCFGSDNIPDSELKRG
jgi:hypothetical protein